MDVETVEIPNGPKEGLFARLFHGQELQVRARSPEVVLRRVAMVLLTSIDVCCVIAGGFARAVLRL